MEIDKNRYKWYNRFCVTKKIGEKEWIFIVSKCIKYYGRRLFKISLIVLAGLLIIASFIYIKYKPLYKVTLNGKVIGYVEDKGKMQEKIEEFANNLEGNITSIKIEAMPEYDLELVSNDKASDTQESEVLATIKENAEITCRTYAIKLDGNEKALVNTQEEAETVINEIKSSVAEGVELNLEVEEQEKNIKEIDPSTTTTEVAKTEINKDVEVKVQEYEKAQEEARQAEEAKKIAAAKAAASVSARSSSARGTAGASIPATGAAFMKPVSGYIITSPYGYRSSGFHTGLDMAVSTGTPVYAAASGTVTFAGYKGSYGYLVIIDHGNGYQTYYAHCSALYVSAGQSVAQGQNISAVGSTGNSTGPHLHFEIRYNGRTLNPQSYI